MIYSALYNVSHRKHWDSTTRHSNKVYILEEEEEEDLRFYVMDFILYLQNCFTVFVICMVSCSVMLYLFCNLSFSRHLFYIISCYVKLIPYNYIHFSYLTYLSKPIITLLILIMVLIHVNISADIGNWWKGWLIYRFIGERGVWNSLTKRKQL